MHDGDCVNDDELFTCVGGVFSCGLDLKSFDIFVFGCHSAVGGQAGSAVRYWCRCTRTLVFFTELTLTIFLAVCVCNRPADPGECLCFVADVHDMWDVFIGARADADDAVDGVVELVILYFLRSRLVPGLL